MLHKRCMPYIEACGRNIWLTLNEVLSDYQMEATFTPQLGLQLQKEAEL